MVRAFRPDPIDRGLLARLVNSATRSPSAGRTGPARARQGPLRPRRRR
ncbi:MAG: nitroreductase family protein [Ilumatobacteraceae bacterium]